MHTFTHKIKPSFFFTPRLLGGVSSWYGVFIVVVVVDVLQFTLVSYVVWMLNDFILIFCCAVLDDSPCDDSKRKYREGTTGIKNIHDIRHEDV